MKKSSEVEIKNEEVGQNVLTGQIFRALLCFVYLLFLFFFSLLHKKIPL